ncbi:hypothetical protein MPTK2_3g19870 [Marchantia polymorpha subsp. ruderalis]
MICKHNVRYANICLNNAPENVIIKSLNIQMKILKVHTFIVKNCILKKIEDLIFCLLVNKARDESTEEQMYLVFQYVYNKSAITSTLNMHMLLFSRVCKQGYDGASNVGGAISDLSILIPEEFYLTYYVHFLAGRLQLAIMFAAKFQFEFVFMLHLFKSILLKTMNLSSMPQKKDQEIVNDMDLVHITKVKLENLCFDQYLILLTRIALLNPANLKDAVDFGQLMALSKIYPMYFTNYEHMIMLVLTLPLNTASAECTFSSLKMVKTRLLNKKANQ